MHLLVTSRDGRWAWRPGIDRIDIALFGSGALIHGIWALFVLIPPDWDPAYYQEVARHIAAGDGAVTGALWTLAWLPERLPFDADTYWMPLPSRVLVPFVWLWPTFGAISGSVLLAAGLGPLGRRTGLAIGLLPREAMLAGVLCATGMGYVRVLSTPDSIALMGVVGGLAVLAMWRDRPSELALWGALAAVTRSDGFLLSMGLCLGLSRRRWVGLAGPLIAGVWHLRNAALVGPHYVMMRMAVANAVDRLELTDLILANAPPLSIVSRLSLWALDGLPAAMLVFCMALPFPVVALLVNKARANCKFLAVAVALALGTVGTPLLAPGVASSGSGFRFAVAFLPIACAVMVGGFKPLADFGQRTRKYHRAFLPALWAAAVLGLGWGGQAQLVGLKPLIEPSVCADFADLPRDAVVFSPHPTLFEAICGLRGVVLIDDMRSPQIRELTVKYNVVSALILPPDLGYEAAVSAEEAKVLLPGWVARSDRRWDRR